jgi:tetratricopeptide (TPR) repeat protein
MEKRIKLLLMLLCFTVMSQAQDRRQFINGTITSQPDNQPVSNAVVTIKGTFLETETNANGAFTMAVAPEDALVVNAFLMYPKTVAIPPKSKTLDIQLDYNAEVLEAIKLREKQASEGYLEKDFIEKDKKEVGYSYEDLQTQFINGADIDLYTVARKIPMLDVVGDPFGGQVVYSSRMRGALGGSKVPMQVIVDGVPVEQNALAFIDPRQVTNITVYRSLAGTVKYGTFGAGGVMRITTKNTAQLGKDKRKIPSLLREGNNYEEGVLPISDNTTMATSPFIEEIKKYPTAEEAFTVYNIQRKMPATKNLAYYLDMATYFSKWGDAQSYIVLSNLFEQANKNPRILKAIAFKLEEQGHVRQATYVIEELLNLRPGHIQSYRDLAKLYVQIGKYNLAATLYKQMIYNTVPNVDFEPLHPIIFNEFRHLIANHKSKIDYSNIPNEFLSVNFKKDVRIVLEYTNPQAEFEVQFVSPKKKYYTWRHTSFDNKDLMEDEIAKGFALKEFIIEDANYGNWLVNVKNVNGSAEGIPTLLKYTLYQNYGLPTEKKEVKVLNLANQSEKGTIDTFVY